MGKFGNWWKTLLAGGAGVAALAAVNAAAAKYAAPAGTTLLLVGDLSKIEAGVRELNLGEIVILDVEGKPAAKK